MQPANPRKKQLIIIGSIFGAIFAVLIIVAIIFQLSPKNDYGNGVKIQNFDQKVKNVSTELRSGVEATLYNVLKKNNPDNTKLSKIGDAFIRDSSDKQDYDKPSDVYTGNFIVDIESIKQSYFVQYTYVKNKDNKDGLANRVVISCLAEKDLKYGSFKCSDFVEQQAAKNDSIIQYLPYSNFSFSITADTTAGDDHLILKVELRIPEADLKGNLASKQATVALYKNEVALWFKSKNIDPALYTFQYNYNDNGDVTAPINLDGGDSV